MTAEQMASLHARCFITPRPWAAAEIAGLQADPLCFILTKPDGFLIGRVVADEAEILTLAVAPEARGRGVGAGLVQGFLAEAQKRGAKQAFLEVAADNAPATRLYSRAGFTEAGRRRGYYARADIAPLDALVLARPI